MLTQAAVFGWADKTPARQFGEELRAVGGPRWSPRNDEDMDVIDRLPSGYVKIAIENDHRNSGFTHW